MRAAAVQMNSNQDKQRNVATAERLVRAAAGDGCTLVVLPEKFNAIGTEAQLREAAEPLDGPTVAWACELARELGIDLVAGSIAEHRPDRDRLSNTCVHVGPDGELRATYRKIHMFDVVVGGREYRESASEERGDEIVVSEAGDAGLGLSVCYDLRFPELFRILAVRGARVIAAPSAFTAVTGAAHWDTLVRARAIENQAFVVAADQFGPHGGGMESHGRSQIVGPWGDVLARLGEGEGFAAADLDLDRQDEVRASLPSLANRVPSAYRWPEEARA